MTTDYLILSKWAKFCKSHGFINIYPSSSDLDIEGDFVILQNCNGLIARYNMVTGKFSLSRWAQRKMEGVLYDVALKTFIKYHEDNPSVYDDNGNYVGEWIWQQPSRDLTRFTCRYVYLNNINGQLAKYDIRKQQIVA